jgi:uncharacterized membrane protein (UPF0127 family)
MKKLIIVYVVLIVVVIILAVVRAGGNFSLPSFSFFNNSEADVNGKKIDLILAKSDNERMKGLSGRNSLGENQGMLFIFDKKDKYPFWMKEMKFPIDIIYLDDDTVVFIVENAPEPKGQADALTIYRPDKNANRVLELNAGKAREFGIKEGTKIGFKGI